MSKTLKRIFSAALVLCMLLAVLPATAPVAEAAAYTPAADMEQIVFNFKKPSGGPNSPLGITSANYKNYTDADGKTLNWYAIGNSNNDNTSNTKWGTYSVYSAMSNTAHYSVFVLDLPQGTNGKYQFTLMDENGDVSVIGYRFMSTDDAMLADIEATTTKVMNYTSTNTVLYGTMNLNRVAWGSAYASIGMLGEAELTAGKYVMVIKAAKDDGNCYGRPIKLTLTKSSNKADALNMALAEAYTSTTYSKYLVMLGNNYDAGTDGVVFTKPDGNSRYAVLDLCGYTLTAGSVDASISGHIVDSKRYNTGVNGSIIAAQKPMLMRDNGNVNEIINSQTGARRFHGHHAGYYMLETAENTYQFYQPTTSAVKEAYNEYKDGDTTATTYTQGEDVACFAFNAKLPDAVLAAAKANPADVKVTMSWYVDKHAPTVTAFSEESIADWLDDNGATKAFYVNLQGLDEAPEGTVITCTPYITIGDVSYTFEDIVLTITAAA